VHVRAVNKCAAAGTGADDSHQVNPWPAAVSEIRAAVIATAYPKRSSEPPPRAGFQVGDERLHELIAARALESAETVAVEVGPEHEVADDEHGVPEKDARNREVAVLQIPDSKRGGRQANQINGDTEGRIPNLAFQVGKPLIARDIDGRLLLPHKAMHLPGVFYGARSKGSVAYGRGSSGADCMD
jgi:hypothetical protein